ncbi:MAG: histidine--tRNA ligase [Planctomycetes bacterium]|nr:histidine--tRNA ligase [Planctomycetota bacterium]
MAKATFQAPRGTRDMLPEDLVLTRHLERTARAVAVSSGFAEIRTPFFEETRLFTRSLGETSDVVSKEMFTVPSRAAEGKKGSRSSYTFRPEGTAGVARAYVNGGYAAKAPLQKWYYLGPMFRYERPQKGRERQFTQFGIEAFGATSPLLDAEVVDLAVRFFEALGFGSELEVRVSTMGDSSDRDRWREALRDYFCPQLEERCADCQSRFERNVFRLLDCKVPRCVDLSAEAPQLAAVLGEEAADHHEAFLAALRVIGREPVVDSSIVRGLDYYTRTVFEVHYPSLGARSALCGGGRYDGLVEEFGGAPTPGVGFAVGFTATELALKELGLPPQEHVADLEAERCPCVFVAAVSDAERGSVFALASRLRREGVHPVVLDYRGKSLKAQLKEASKSGAAYTVVLGANEVAAGTAVLRDMAAGEEVALPQAELAEHIASQVISSA